MQIKEIFKNSIEKTNAIMKKIFNFLKLKRFSIIGLVGIMSICCLIGSCNIREPTSANAQELSGDRLIVTPSVRTTYRYGSNTSSFYDGATIQSFFLSIDEDWTFNSFYSFYMNTENVDYGYKEYVYTYSNTTNLPYYQVNIPLSLLFLRDTTSGIDYNALTQSYTVTASFIIHSSDYGTLVPSVCQVINSSSGYALGSNTLSTSYAGIRYLYRTNTTTLFEFALTYSTSRGFSFTTDGFTSLFMTITPDLALLDLYTYEKGYNEGYYQGLLATAEEHTVWGVITSSIDSFLDIELFGTLTIGNIVQIGFGIILIGFVIKIFLGG